ALGLQAVLDAESPGREQFRLADAPPPASAHEVHTPPRGRRGGKLHTPEVAAAILRTCHQGMNPTLVREPTTNWKDERQEIMVLLEPRTNRTVEDQFARLIVPDQPLAGKCAPPGAGQKQVEFKLRPVRKPIDLNGIANTVQVEYLFFPLVGLDVI